MNHTEADQTVFEEPFSLTLDQYGRLWLHTKLDGIEVAIDLAHKDDAFNIMAECDFEYRASRAHGDADNDDQPR